MEKEVKEIPIGVKIIAIFHYICAGIFFIIGVLFLFIGRQVFSNELEGGNSSLIMILTAIFVLIFVLLYFFIGRGLWKGQNWARIVVIIFSIGEILVAIIMLFIDFFTGISIAIISGIIAGYLLFNSKVKQAFS